MRIKQVIPTALLGATSAVALGLVAMQAPTVTTSAADDAAKREDDQVELVLVDDDDDDDSRDRSRFTGVSRSTRDGTRSNVTRVSRDRDRSRSDKTRDRTYDGVGGLKRDWSGGRTNDRSRNDSRW